MPKQQLIVETVEVTFVPTDNVEPNPFNPNVMEEDKRLELKRLMKATNARTFFLKNPLRASPYEVFYGQKLDEAAEVAPEKRKYVFIDGQHRWQNAKELNAEGVKGWIEIGIRVEQTNMAQARQECYSVNYLRGTIDPIKEAKLFEMELKDLRTVERVAKKYHKEPGYVSRTLALLQLPEKVQAFLYDERYPLKRTHLEHLIGLPEEKMIEIADIAARNRWTADEVKERADLYKKNAELEKKKAEQIAHYVMKECPVCGAPGELEDDLKHMVCSKGFHHYDLGLRNELKWNPLDTKEDFLKRKFRTDDGEDLPLEEIIKRARKKRAVPKKKPDWFKYEKTADELMPKINEYAWMMLLANRDKINIKKISIYADLKESPSPVSSWSTFSITTNDRGLMVQIGQEELYMFFEDKEWKRGPFKTKITVRGVKKEENLVDVRSFLDKLMKGEAKVEDYPFHVKDQDTKLLEPPKEEEAKLDEEESEDLDEEKSDDEE